MPDGGGGGVGGWISPGSKEPQGSECMRRSPREPGAEPELGRAGLAQAVPG